MKAKPSVVRDEKGIPVSWGKLTPSERAVSVGGTINRVQEQQYRAKRRRAVIIVSIIGVALLVAIVFGFIMGGVK